MKKSWWVYVVVGVVSAIAGVAIAGTPDSVGSSPTIEVPEATTTTTEATITEATIESVITVASTTSSAPAVSNSVSASSTSTAVSTTTTTSTVGFDRSTVRVVSVNGAGTGGLAIRVRDELGTEGFVETRATDGTRIVDDTTVYFLPGFEVEAGQVALALGLDPFSIKPVVDAPDFGQQDDDEVVVYLGRDRA